MHVLQGHRVTEWVADAIGLPQYVPVFKDNLITVSRASFILSLVAASFLHVPKQPPISCIADISPSSLVPLAMQVLDFPVLVNDGGASLKSDLGVGTALFLHHQN